MYFYAAWRISEKRDDRDLFINIYINILTQAKILKIVVLTANKTKIIIL